MALRGDRQVVAWGQNDYGECDIPPPPAGVWYVATDGGLWHTVALRSDGQVVAWGSNYNGQCNTPALAAGLSFVEVAAGGSQTVARYEASCPEPTSYCTAKPNSLGCTPSIGMSGKPSATTGSGCRLGATSVPGNVIGLFVHSSAGPETIPFHGGWWCVGAPIWRHAGVHAGGTAGTCSGVLAEDLNAFVAAGADPALIAGATIWIQAWYRDPADPFGDGLSDALSATICP